MTILREFFIRIGTKADHTGLNKAKASIDSIGKTAMWAGGAIAAFTGTAYLFKSFVDSVTAAGDAMIKTSRNIGLTAEEMQKFEYAGQISGIAIEGMRNSIKFLNKNMSEAAEGLGTGKKAFDRLGISVKDTSGKLKSNTDIFQEVSEKIGSLGKEQKTLTLMEIFGRAGAQMGNLFMKGSKGVKELFDRFGDLNLAIDTKTLEAMEEYNDRVLESDLAMKKLKAEFIGPLLPALSKMAVAFREKLGKAIEWVGNNTERISKGFEMFMKALKFAGIAGLLFTLGKLSFALSGLVGAFTAAGASAVLAWAGALVGPLLIGGAVAAVTLLIDDMWDTYMNPEVKTFTRWFLDKLEKDFPTAFNSLKAMVNTLKLSLAGLGLAGAMIFGNEDQIKIWESMVADYGGRVYRSAGKAAGVQDDDSGWDRFRNFPGVKQFIDSMPITAATNALQYSFLKNPPSAADFSPMSPVGKVYNIGTVQVQTDSGSLDELIYNIETTTEKMKGKGN